MAQYPSNIFSWSNRKDNVNVVFANDPNTLASEVQAIETIIGPNPQIEVHGPVPARGPSGPQSSNQNTFGSLNLRVSAAMSNAMLPFCSLTNPGVFIGQGQQFFNSYNILNDPYQMYNGKDITITNNGWFTITASQKWNQHGNSFRGGNVLFLYLNGNWIDADIWNWNNFFGDPTFTYANNVFNSNGYTRLFWQGQLHGGDRIQVLSANSTFCPGIGITNMQLKVLCNVAYQSGYNQGFASG